MLVSDVFLFFYFSRGGLGAFKHRPHIACAAEAVTERAKKTANYQ